MSPNSPEARANGLFSRILIANRGEIAVRITRAIHELCAQAVAVYSDADAGALHTRMADFAVRIGSGSASQSYLNIDAILEAARNSGAEAIHPGYGFLSENADFAEAVVNAGLVFIGPPDGVIRLMGDKIAAKNLMAANGVPLVPGYDGEEQDDSVLAREAARIGYPVMVKAAAGGGGRGMRTVESPDELADALDGARREATAAFGDGRVFLEKLLVGPRHIEVQVLGDSYGNLIHLYERDCSVQRRHQKVIEEAPSPALSEEQRAAICAAGVQAARAAGYVNAGTVEFIWQDGDFHFLEMNTRIQVEHPVTEQVTGRDLVKAQIQIAAGYPLPWKQEEIALQGHSVEARLYAEDPAAGFLPQPGVITGFSIPEFGPESVPESAELRVDSGVVTGSEISRFYDPMIAKIIVTAAERDAAVDGLSSALIATEVLGVKTNRDFLLGLLATDEFRRGDATTGLAESWSFDAPASPDEEARLLAAFGALVASEKASFSSSPRSTSPWSVAGPWRQGGQGMRVRLALEGRTRELAASRDTDRWASSIDGGPLQLVTCDYAAGESGSNLIVVTQAARRVAFEFRWSSSDTVVLDDVANGRSFVVRVNAPFDLGPRLRKGDDAGSPTGSITSPMPGSLIKIHVSEGDVVSMGQPLVVLEAMKMEHALHAPHAGTVALLPHAVGDVVRAGDLLVEITGYD